MSEISPFTVGTAMDTAYVDTSATGWLYQFREVAKSMATTSDGVTTNEVLTAIESLDRRIAAFEKVSIPATKSDANASADYPYDRDALKREFLEEVLALMIRASKSANPTPPATATLLQDRKAQVATNNVITTETGDYASTGQVLLDASGTVPRPVLTGAFPRYTFTFDNSSNTGQTTAAIGDATKQTGGYTNFANHRMEENVAYYFGEDPKAFGIFNSYQKLVDDTFAAGDALANDTSPAAQVVTAIPAITIDGVTYNHLATVSAGNDEQGVPKPSGQYLLAADPAKDFSRVSKTTELTGTGSATSRLQLYPLEASDRGTTLLGDPDAYLQTYTIDDPEQGLAQFTITLKREGGTGKVISYDDITLTTNDPANPNITASSDQITLPMFDPRANTQSSTYDPLIPKIAISRRFSVGATDYLVSLSQDQTKVYVTSLGASKQSKNTLTRNLTAGEYLLHMNEVRIKILRGQLAYNESVVREIQDDLRRANEALADLEKQSGLITDTTGNAAITTVETLKLSLFNAVASTNGVSMFERAGGTGDSKHNKIEWGAARTVLKNYIDRRSSEAQQATLDYQNVLNRYNGAYETMAKLQEKLDNLLKGQLRNFS